VGGRIEAQLEKEAGRTQRQQVGGQAAHDLIGLPAHAREAVHELQCGARADSTQEPQKRIMRVVSPHGAAERAHEQSSLERDVDAPAPLGQRAAQGRQRIRDGDAHDLQEEAHARPRRPSCAEATATATITTACSTSTISLGTRKLTTRPPCDSVPKNSAAGMIASGWLRANTATAMPM